nr:MAG TPA: hypothetical protein [Bacteriophage sp.]
MITRASSNVNCTGKPSGNFSVSYQMVYAPFLPLLQVYS